MTTGADAAESLAREVTADGLASATISGPRKTDVPSRVRVRAIRLQGRDIHQAEEIRGAQAFHRNLEDDELVAYLIPFLSGDYTQAEFRTARGLVRALVSKKGKISVRRDATTPRDAKAPPQTVDHDRSKHYILEEGVPVPFLVELGIMTEEGRVVASRRDKFRQINRFLEIIDDVLPELTRDRPSGEPIRVVDFGCGKSYLTFACHHLISQIRGIDARIVGLDLKADVIAECSDLASRYGSKGLSFAVGDIASYPDLDRVDLVISLHACDLATDYALDRATRAGARAILAVPCCQHELNAQLASPTTAAAPARATLAPLLRHGILRERFAALATDALRAELLEAAGYRVQVLEFVDMSHTPKNLLIRAVKRQSAEPTDRARERYRALRDALGVDPTLGRLAGES